MRIENFCCVRCCSQGKTRMRCFSQTKRGKDRKARHGALLFFHTRWLLQTMASVILQGGPKIRRQGCDARSSTYLEFWQFASDLSLFICSLAQFPPKQYQAL
ncbi:hypothetical protein Y032_0398g715 [Ancylostoma ceylanicum]|uniref:Uncharacterized protein n=1 Tax=Ancylostoma ceylanicum TaxID=53326 RepID=A0A016RR80_9BILA|nr:hypothetical protein Y032_0398g715 [Ancylostoma ceylanicum]